MGIVYYSSVTVEPGEDTPDTPLTHQPALSLSSTTISSVHFSQILSVKHMISVRDQSADLSILVEYYS